MNIFPAYFSACHPSGYLRSVDNSSSSPAKTLAEIPAGSLAKVIGFRPGLAAERQTQLQSYGLAPGHTVRVMQHNPVTVLLIDQFELALEREMAAYVEVAQIPAD